MIAPSAEETRKVKGATVGGRGRMRAVMRTVVRTVGEATAASTSTASRASTATATASPSPFRPSSALILFRSNFFGVRDIHGLVRLVTFTAGSLLSLVCLLALLIADSTVGSTFAREPRTPDEAVSLGGWRRSSWTMSMPMGMRIVRRVRASWRTKGETRHERGKWSFSLVIYSPASCLIGVKVLNKVPEVCIVEWVWLSTHFV
jgi:hypothetical protein